MNCSGALLVRDLIIALSRLKFCQQLHATSTSKPEKCGFVCYMYLKPISYPFRPCICMTGTGCLSKVDMTCKNDTQLMPKIRKLKGYCRNVTITVWRLWDIVFCLHVHTHTHTHTTSLLSRLALPVCLNYLYMIQVVRLVHHDDDTVPETAFAYVRTLYVCEKHYTVCTYWIYHTHLNVIFDINPGLHT